MEKFSYSCDIASLKVGKSGVYFYIPNGIGDGDYNVYIGTCNKDYEKLPKGSMFCGVVEGKNLSVYDYDCTDGEVLTKISGRYMAYNDRNGNVYLLKIGE